VKIAEDFFCPQIDATFAGITMGEFDDSDALRPEEEKKGDDPESRRPRARTSAV